MMIRCGGLIRRRRAAATAAARYASSSHHHRPSATSRTTATTTTRIIRQQYLAADGGDGGGALSSSYNPTTNLRQQLVVVVGNNNSNRNNNLMSQSYQQYHLHQQPQNPRINNASTTTTAAALRSPHYSLLLQHNNNNHKNNNQIIIRWMSSNGNSNSSNNGGGGGSGGSGTTTTKKEAQPRRDEQQQKEERDLLAQTKAQTQQLSSSFEQRIKDTVKRTVEIAGIQMEELNQLNRGDVYTVVGIASLLFTLVLAPFLINRLKQQPDDLDPMADTVFDEFFSADDPIDDLTKLARRSWGIEVEDKDDDKNDEEEYDVDEETGEKKPRKKHTLEYMFRDVLKTEALQQAAQEFVVEVLQSQPVQLALQRLVKTLFKDLVEDPETVAQIIKLLQFAIQNPDVKKSAQQLVLDIIDEPEVKRSISQLLQSLGQDDDVLHATQTLLSDSAHRALDDPDLLEHSMEFATDVVGDDIVQRTAGEALRNTVGHAVRPSSTIVLTAAGVGLLVVSILAIGYSRSSEQEARVVETAAQSLKINATTGIWRILTWPNRRIIQPVLSKLGYAVSYPFVLFNDHVLIPCTSTVLQFVNQSWTEFVSLPGRCINTIHKNAVQIGVTMKDGITNQIQSLWGTISNAVVAVVQAAITRIRNASQATTNTLSNRISQLTTLLIAALTQRFPEACRQQLSNVTAWFTRATDRIDDVLIQYILQLEDMIRNALEGIRQRPKQR